MAGVLDPFLYISYLGRRWKFVLLSAAVAVALATCVTLTLPREYTATARLVVEPPAGADPRSAMSVSPIYFESLKTYEQFAASDSLFRKALDRFHLRADLGARPIESLKKQVLKVGMIRNTRILEISATLPDARKAHELAQFVAESTVNLNRGVVAEGGEDLLRGFTAEAAEARARLDEADAAWARQLAVEPIQDLQAAIESAADMRAKIEEEAIHAEVDLADAAQREKQAPETEAALVRGETANARARLEEMRKQLAALDRQTAAREKLLAERMAHRDRIEAERKAAQSALTSVENRLREARGDAGYRGERLKIVDPGIVPERPSSPNLPLNVAVALLLGLIFPVVYLTLQWNLRELRVSQPRGIFHALAKARDD
ncbi:MAG: Wzz/FepE/Etk N-terminal domain-containing protein [Bryobacteraceae bacterium]